LAAENRERVKKEKDAFELIVIGDDGEIAVRGFGKKERKRDK
jgi:hypothetical protein